MTLPVHLRGAGKLRLEALNAGSIDRDTNMFVEVTEREIVLAQIPVHGRARLRPIQVRRLRELLGTFMKINCRKPQSGY